MKKDTHTNTSALLGRLWALASKCGRDLFKKVINWWWCQRKKESIINYIVFKRQSKARQVMRRHTQTNLFLSVSVICHCPEVYVETSRRITSHEADSFLDLASKRQRSLCFLFLFVKIFSNRLYFLSCLCIGCVWMRCCIRCVCKRERERERGEQYLLWGIEQERPN